MGRGPKDLKTGEQAERFRIANPAGEMGIHLAPTLGLVGLLTPPIPSNMVDRVQKVWKSKKIDIGTKLLKAWRYFLKLHF